MSSSSIELWQAFVDAFVSLHDGVHHNWVVERGEYPDFPENNEANALLSALSPAQRETLANMLVDARSGGIHDTLVALHDRIALNDATYSERGVAMRFMPHGFTLYQDFVGRKAGDPWPESRDA
jgi:hypothetical protein